MDDVVLDVAAIEGSKCLVVDASIAGSAGKEKPGNTVLSILTPKNCRDTLNAVRRLGFSITMTPEIMKEWDDHQGSFATEWRAAMRRAGRIEMRASCNDESLRNSILSMAEQKVGKVKITHDVCLIMLKDCHLLEAALATDKIIFALDEKARNPMKITAQVVKEIQSVVWVNPDKAEEEAIAWLEAGANPEEHRQLGFQQNAVQ